MRCNEASMIEHGHDAGGEHEHVIQTEESNGALGSAQEAQSPQLGKKRSPAEPLSPGAAQRHHFSLSESCRSFRSGGTDGNPQVANGIDEARNRMRIVVTNHVFDIVVGLLVLVNMAFVGVESNARLLNVDDSAVHTSWFVPVESFFICLYIVELGLRIFVAGTHSLKDSAIIFDSCIILVSIFNAWCAPAEFELPFPIVIARVARVSRVARSMRLLIMYEELWLMVQGLLASIKTMMACWILLTLLLYLFALIAVDLVAVPILASNAPEEIIDIIQNHFATVPATMLTLVQFICLDSIGSIYRPLIMYDWRLSLYFMTTMLVLGVVVMNLVTAVVVKGAFERADENVELYKLKKKKEDQKLLQKLRKMFMELDDDKSGTVDVSELKDIHDEHDPAVHDILKNWDMVAVFEQLDVHGSGSLDIDEFIEGMHETIIKNTPPQLQGIVKTLDTIRADIESVCGKHDAALGALQESVDAMAMKGERPFQKTVSLPDPALPFHDVERAVASHQTLPIQSGSSSRFKMDLQMDLFHAFEPANICVVNGTDSSFQAGKVHAQMTSACAAAAHDEASTKSHSGTFKAALHDFPATGRKVQFHQGVGQGGGQLAGGARQTNPSARQSLGEYLDLRAKLCQPKSEWSPAEFSESETADEPHAKIP